LDSYTVIDVRNSNELVSGYIQGAIHIPLHRIKEGKFNLEKEKKYATVCAHGIRSRMAANVLIEKGYDAKTVTGGMAIWLIRDFEVDYP
jgi:Rhodanese-related sulfurtransferase